MATDVATDPTTGAPLGAAADPAAPQGPPAKPAPRVIDVPRAVSARTLDDVLSLVGSLAASFAVVWLCYLQILPLSGTLGFLFCWWMAFLGIYAIVTAQSNPGPIVIDRLMAALITGAAAIVGFALVATVLYTVVEGYPAWRHLNFFTQDGSGAGPNDPFTKGGIYHALVGTLIEIGIASAIALPLGVGTAVFMTEVGGPAARVVRIVVESMTALPDILAGLFIYTVLILELGQSKNGLAAALALTVMMLPIIARSADVVLRVAPGGLREASLALGATQWRTVWSVVLPTARSGLATALILGIARAIGETAPVLITSGASSFTTYDPFGHAMNSLPLYILQTKISGENNFVTRGFGAASVLLALVIVMFAITRLLARSRAGSR